MALTPRKILSVTSFYPGARGYIGAGEAISVQAIRRLRADGAQLDVLAIAPRYQRRNALAEAWRSSYTEVPASRGTAVVGVLRYVFSGAALAPFFLPAFHPRR